MHLMSLLALRQTPQGELPGGGGSCGPKPCKSIGTPSSRCCPWTSATMAYWPRPAQTRPSSCGLCGKMQGGAFQVKRSQFLAGQPFVAPSPWFNSDGPPSRAPRVSRGTCHRLPPLRSGFPLRASPPHHCGQCCALLARRRSPGDGGRRRRYLRVAPGAARARGDAWGRGCRGGRPCALLEARQDGASRGIGCHGRRVVPGRHRG